MAEDIGAHRTRVPATRGPSGLLARATIVRRPVPRQAGARDADHDRRDRQHGPRDRALAGGHDVTLVGTERAKAEELAGELGGAGGSGSVQAGAAPTGDGAVLAGPYPAVAGILDANRDALAGTVLVDITNPVDFSTFTPLDLDAGSGAP